VHGHALQGLGRKGFVIVALVAVLNATRRTINLVLAPPFSDFLAAFVSTFASSLLLGVVVLLSVVWTVNRVPQRGPRQYAAVAGTLALATLVCIAGLLAWESDGTFDLDDPAMTPGRLAFIAYSFFLRYYLLGLLITGAWLYLRADAEQRAAIARCQLHSARMDQQTAEARLAMLEAQIEPHFLFNTLASVKRLYDIDRSAGARMLGHLVTYLGAALPSMREATSSLGREIGHACAYLDIHRIRMGRRLAYDVDVPGALMDARMPPLMVLTLVENAVKHGLNPLPEGGRVHIRARRHGDRLELTVADTGRGFVEATGAGTGLANIRARLATQFGDAARLSLSVTQPHGVHATIVLPFMQAESTPALQGASA
jgi:signal transduction histidine kinase